MTTPGRIVVRRLVDEVINGGDLTVLDELCTRRLAAKLTKAFAEFRTAFPDWRQEIVTLVEEDGVVAVRYRCTGTQTGRWARREPTGRRMEVDEVHFLWFEEGRIARLWALEDTWTRDRQLDGRITRTGELGALDATW